MVLLREKIGRKSSKALMGTFEEEVQPERDFGGGDSPGGPSAFTERSLGTNKRSGSF